jgi:hypothetical protein
MRAHCPAEILSAMHLTILVADAWVDDIAWSRSTPCGRSLTRADQPQ